MNKTILITGASRGIGRAMAIEFAKNGYNLVLTCHTNIDNLIELKNSLSSYDITVDYYQCDHSDFNSSLLLIEEIMKNHTKIDILVNNAGISSVGLLQDISKYEWDDIWNTNVTSVISMCKGVIPYMLKEKQGKIINISSVWGLTGASCECAYSATKGAINSFTKALAKELAPSNIQVNAICCGIIDTDMNSHLTSEDIECIENDIPAGRIGSASDIAKVAMSIAETGNYMTGQLITVDGGWI